MRIIVTGGAGFVGSAVCRRLVRTGAEVVNVDKLTYAGNLASLGGITREANYRYLRANVGDFPVMERLFDEVRPDAVMHLAAESHVDRSISDAREFIETNIVGTFTLLEAARRYWSSLDAAGKGRFRFLQVSTDEVYGTLGVEGQFTEKSPYEPSSPYSASKASADHLARAWHTTYGLPTIVSCSSNNYGPHQFPEKLIPLTLLNALDGRPLPVYGAGSNVRDWLYVEDHARALTMLVEHGRPGATYNIGGRAERTNLAVVEAICAILDGIMPEDAPHARLITFVADRPGHDHRYAIDCTRIETELGWRPLDTFSTGLAKTVRWYLANEWWWRKLRDRIYGGERLGLLPVVEAVNV